MYSVSRAFYTVFLIVNLLTISCFQVNGQDKEIEEIHENAKELYSKLIACTKNQTKCEEFDEITTQIESNFAKGNHLFEKNKKYMQHIYSQFKFPHEENHFNFGEDTHLFRPKKLKKLTEEEKKIPFEERFAKKYIGEIPRVVHNIIHYLRYYEEYSKTQLKAPNQILLHGSPATGKNHLVKTIAEELELPIIEISAATFSDKYYGESAKRIRRFFEYLENREELTTVFIDEIDALAKKRNENTQGEERASLTNLLTEIQKIKDNKKIFIFCATNDFEELDPALKSRFLKAEIKDLPLEDRPQLFKKAFADNGKEIEDDFARMLAKVTSEKSEKFSEYSTTTRVYSQENKTLNEHHFSAFGFSLPNSYLFKRTKYHPSRFVFDNRDIGNVAILTLLNQQECLKNYSDQKKCLLCQSAQEAISEIKQVQFDYEWNKWCYKK